MKATNMDKQMIDPFQVTSIEVIIPLVRFQYSAEMRRFGDGIDVEG